MPLNNTDRSNVVYTLKKYGNRDSPLQLKFFTLSPRLCKLERNLASQAASFMKQTLPWRPADFLLSAWITSICLLSSCCGQLCWKRWCVSRELERKKVILESRDFWGERNPAESTRGSLADTRLLRRGEREHSQDAFPDSKFCCQKYFSRRFRLSKILPKSQTSTEKTRQWAPAQGWVPYSPARSDSNAGQQTAPSGVVWKALGRMRGCKRSWKFQNNQAASCSYGQDRRTITFLLFLLTWIQPPNYVPNRKFFSHQNSKCWSLSDS